MSASVRASYTVRHGYLRAARGDLLVTLHRQPEPAPVVLIVSAFGVSCSEPRYLMTLLARRLAAEGMTVVQYDHPADGDSTGSPAEIRAGDLLDGAQQALTVAAGHSSGAIAVVGYGIGNAIACTLLDQPGVGLAVLISPCLRAWDLDWVAACPRPDGAGMIAPPVTADRTALGDIWRAIYGEPVVLSQPPAPVSASLVGDLARADPRPALARHRTSVLLISDLDSDLTGQAGPSLRLTHEASSVQPSWHWNFTVRSSVIEAITGWLGAARSEVGAVDQAEADDPQLQDQASDGKAIARSVQVCGETVLGVLRQPDVPAAANELCVIYEPGNPGQRVDIHRAGPVLAETLAGRGLASFRYDPRGMGTSQGDYQQMTWSARLTDLTCVMDSLEADGYKSFAVVGNSAGARVAVRAACTDRRIAGVVLWDPVLRDAADSADGAVPALIRVPGGVATEWCGLPLGLRYQRDEREYDYLNALAQVPVPTCLVLAVDGVGDSAVLAAAPDDVAVHHVAGTHGFNWPGLLRAVDISAQWILTTHRRGVMP